MINTEVSIPDTAIIGVAREASIGIAPIGGDIGIRF